MPPVTGFGGYDVLAGAAEHPVVRRHRHRRLLAFLRHQGLEGTFESMVQEAFFSVAHLQDLMKQGQWHDALTYLSRFLQLDDDRLLSLEAQVLYGFLSAHRNLADILAGSEEGRVLGASLSKYLTHDRNFCHGDLRLKSIMLTVLHAKQLLRVSWERVRQRAAEIAYDLVHRTPELKGMLPPGPMEHHNVLPIRTCNGWRYRRKKHPRRPQASALAQRYLARSRSLVSSSHSKKPDNELYAQAVSWTADILDESLKAGKLQELHQKHPLEISGKQGTNKCCSQEGCNEESAHPGFNPRKELTTSGEQDLHPKRQHTIGTFGETNLMAQGITIAR